MPTQASSATPTAPARLRLKVLLNGGGGTVRRHGAEALRDRLAAVLAGQGADAEFLLLRGDELADAARQALADRRAGRIDAVVVGGGDGSVSTVAGVLAGTGVPLGVLPLGTLNHFAKDLGMPQEPEAAAAALVAARPRRADVAEVNGRVFVNNSLLGAYPYMVVERERQRERRGLGKWPAMAWAFLRMLWRFPRRRLALEAEGWTRPYRTPLLFVGVNEYSMEKLRLRRPRGLDGGHLWLMVARHRTPFGFFRFAVRTALRGLQDSDDFELLQVTHAEVRTLASRVLVSRDGEVERMRGPLRYRIRPGDLTVLAPDGDGA